MNMEMLSCFNLACYQKELYICQVSNILHFKVPLKRFVKKSRQITARRIPENAAGKKLEKYLLTAKYLVYR